MDVMQRLANSVVVPVVVLDKVEDAIPTAKAMAAGGAGSGKASYTAAASNFIRFLVKIKKH